MFSSGGRWYIGSPQGMHIGPYRDRKSAVLKSARIAKSLKLLKNDHERLQLVRKVLHQEWDSVDPGTDRRRKNAEPPPSAAPVREGEPQKHWYRSDRFFQVDGVWFFATREGIDVGPFNSEADAKRHERKLVALLKRTRSGQQAHRMIYEYKHRPDGKADPATNPEYHYSLR